MAAFDVCIGKALPARKRGKVKRYAEYVYRVRRALSRQNALALLTAERPLALLYAHSVSVVRVEIEPTPRVTGLRTDYPVSAAIARVRARRAVREAEIQGRLVY